MEGSDALQIVAEVAVAFMGFAGIATAISRGPEVWTAFDSVRIFSLLGTGLATIMLALLPFALHFAEVDGVALWQWSSGAMCTFLVPYTAVVFRKMSRVTEVSSSGRLLSSPWHPLSLVLGILSAVNFVLQGSNAVGAAPIPPIAAYFLGLWWSVAYCGLVFSAILFERPGSPANKALNADVE